MCGRRERISQKNKTPKRDFKLKIKKLQIDFKYFNHPKESQESGVGSQL